MEELKKLEGILKGIHEWITKSILGDIFEEISSLIPEKMFEGIPDKFPNDSQE